MNEPKDEDLVPLQKRRLAKENIEEKVVPLEAKRRGPWYQKSKPTSDLVKMRDLVGLAESCGASQNFGRSYVTAAAAGKISIQR